MSMRKIKRIISKHNMKKKGFSRINKRNMKNQRGTSFFSTHWRDYINLKKKIEVNN